MKEKIPQPAPVSRTLQGKARESKPASVVDVLQAYKNGIVQQQAVEEEDELLQGKFETAQRDELEDDELLQGKFKTAQRDELEDDELLQGKFETVQRDELEEDELLQGKFETVQRKETPNNTGMPDALKAGVEQLSGLDMSDVRVHYNSSKPANVQAYAYAQGTDIHLAPGQEKNLGHEAWHVAQQKQGRVQPTTTVGGMAVNDNAGLEKEADMMGGNALKMKPKDNKSWVADGSVAKKKNDVKQNISFEYNILKGSIQRMKHWKTNVLSSQIKKEQVGKDEKLVNTAHHILPKSELCKTYSKLTKEEQEDIGKEMGEKGVLSKEQLMSLPFNMTLGPRPEQRSDDPKDKIDPNYSIGRSMTPRSKALYNAWDEQKGQIDKTKLAEALREAKKVHDADPKIDRSSWMPDENGKFKRK